MSHVARAAALAAGLILVAASAHADPAQCEKTLLASLFKYKKTRLKLWAKCLDAENAGKYGGLCLDNASIEKLTQLGVKVMSKVSVACAGGDLSALGYPSSCGLKADPQGPEVSCAGLPAATPSEWANCLMCWKAIELNRYAAILYASHRNEVCDDVEHPSVCSPLECETPLPDQGNLTTGGDNNCQRAIGKAGNKYLVTREKVLEKCGLGGGTRATCLADPNVIQRLQKTEDKKAAAIHNKCGNRTPVANPPYCCQVGTGNACMLSTSRAYCVDNLGGNVQEGKDCVAGTCEPTPPQQPVTWWENCPSAPCSSAPLATLDDLIGCVDETADETVDDLLCQQFPPGTGWCSPSGAFLDPML